ncbi:MAG: ABC transporter permease [Bacilli bacterium]|nr:ABC transporter permease [Bacilli bacterium]
MTLFSNLYNYREFLKTSILKDFRGKYKKSFLGILWSFLNPLFQLLIYSLVFPHIMGNKIENYTVYLIVGLMPWTFFNNTIIQSAACIVTNGGIIKKVFFPREILPISTLTSNLINFLITQIIVLLALIFSGIGIAKTIVLFPLIALLQYILQMGLAFIFSAITVYIRDVEYIINIFMMLMFYLCPILYAPSMLPPELLNVLKLNPMFEIITFYRQILYEGVLPNMHTVFKIFLVCVGVLFIGYMIFRRLEKKFAEEL